MFSKNVLSTVRMETYANVTSVCVRFAKGEEGKRPSLQLKNEQSTAKGEGEKKDEASVNHHRLQKEEEN